MSVESVWDLQCRSAPQSCCLVQGSPAAAASSNPFDSIVTEQEQATSVTLLMGSDQGSLHARTYVSKKGIYSTQSPTQAMDYALPKQQRVVAVLSCTPTLFLILVDDERGSSAAEPGAFQALWIQWMPAKQSYFTLVNATLPRMSCAAVDTHNRTVVYAAGRKLEAIPWFNTNSTFTISAVLPAPGARTGPHALQWIQMPVVAVGNAVYAMVHTKTIKLHSFAQSSQVHPVLVLDLTTHNTNNDYKTVFVASARDCAIVDWSTHVKPRHETTLPTPILDATFLDDYLVLLTTDGLVSFRSTLCLPIALKTVEVGTRPNDYFALLKANSKLLALAHSGKATCLQRQPDTLQDLADRIMRHAIDAFGTNGFPRTDLAEALHATFTATSYVGPEPTQTSKLLLQQYLQAILGLLELDSYTVCPPWPLETTTNTTSSNTTSAFDQAQTTTHTATTRLPIPTVLTASALLCLVCSQLTLPTLAHTAAKACAERVGILLPNPALAAAARVCEQVAQRLLRQASAALSLVPSTSLRNKPPARPMDWTFAAVWLLRSCGQHGPAMTILSEQGSNIQCESHLATHLSELWATQQDETCQLVLTTQHTRQLLQDNPRLGLSVFTALHPQNTQNWKTLVAKDDPLTQSPQLVVALLKTIQPPPTDETVVATTATATLPLESGRALAVAFLESALGLSTGRPMEQDEFDSLPPDPHTQDLICSLHDELAFLLLEGVISERTSNDQDEDTTPLAQLYRNKLRRFLQWPLAQIRSEQLLTSLPESFLQERALVLGRLGRHEDALRILYCDLQSLELALDYCDRQHERNVAKRERQRSLSQQIMFATDDTTPCAYLPLVRVALESSDSDAGTTAAIQVLALRRGSIDRAAALRLLPQDVPVAAVARPFLIPALVDSESQVRRLKVVSAVLRARYVSLKQQLTQAQLKAQANLHVVPQLQSLNLGEPLHSTKAFKARPSSSASSTFPDVMIVKHFFSRHLVLQAKVTNSATDGRALGEVAFVVAESSEEAIQPALLVPIKVLPYKSTGSTWCVLSAMRMEGTAVLTCELRYTVLTGDVGAGYGGAPNYEMGRTFVEELQDLEVPGAHFS